jgi:hypothetical protein
MQHHNAGAAYRGRLGIGDSNFQIGARSQGGKNASSSENAGKEPHGIPPLHAKGVYVAVRAGLLA